MTTTILATLMFALAGAPASDNTKQQVTQLLAQFDHEPSVIEVQRAAARYARVNPDAYDSWVGAANWANVLPEEVRGRLWHLSRDEKDVRTTTSSGSVSDLVADDAHLRLELEVTWDFSRMIFNPDKIKASKEISNIVELREEILTTVNKLYFARRELQVNQLLNATTDVKKALRAQLQIEGLGADLDALTGGWFSRQLVKANRTQKKVSTSSRAKKTAITPAPAPKTP